MKFELNQIYSREDIHLALGGGNRQTYLPTQGGRVLAAFLHSEINPDAPRVILPGTGPLIEGNARVLRRQRQPIPVFLKMTAGWKYVGRFRSSPREPTQAELLEHQQRSQRYDVTTVVWMDPANDVDP